MKEQMESIFIALFEKKAQWVACCESDNLGSGVVIVYCCHLYLPPPHPFLKCSISSSLREKKIPLCII